MTNYFVMFHRIVSESLRVIRISNMSSVVSDFIDLDSFDQPLAAILMTATATRGLICGGPISTFVPNISTNTSAKFGACITK